MGSHQQKSAKSLQLCPTLCDPIDGSPPGSPIPGILQARTLVGWHFLLQCVKLKSESEVVQSCPTPSDPWTAAYQAPPSMGFSRQEYWSGVPLPSPQQKSRYFLILQQISIAQKKRFISRLIGNVDFSSFQVNNLEILHTPSNTTQPVPSINRFWYNESESEVPQSCPTLQPHGLWPTRLLRPWDSPGKSTGVGCHFLLQEIFSTQGSNPGLPHCRLYHLSHQGSSGTIAWNKQTLDGFGVQNSWQEQTTQHTHVIKFPWDHWVTAISTVPFILLWHFPYLRESLCWKIGVYNPRSVFL